MKRSSFNVNLRTPAAAFEQLAELVPPELEKIDRKELRAAVRKYPSLAAFVAFRDDPTCATLAFAVTFAEGAPRASAVDRPSDQGLTRRGGAKPGPWVKGSTVGYAADMRMGNMEVRPLGGAPGCLAMILISIVASVVLTVVLNLLLR